MALSSSLKPKWTSIAVALPQHHHSNQNGHLQHHHSNQNGHPQHHQLKPKRTSTISSSLKPKCTFAAPSAQTKMDIRSTISSNQNGHSQHHHQLKPKWTSTALALLNSLKPKQTYTASSAIIPFSYCHYRFCDYQGHGTHQTSP